MINIQTFDLNDTTCDSYSIELSQLTEFQKKIRLLVKKAKFHVIKLLNHKLKSLDQKRKAKGEEGQSDKMKHKQDEIDFLKSADFDSLSKRIFANKYTIDDLEKSGDKLSVEDRIIIRLFSFTSINQLITEFRAVHTDWEELVDVVLYRNTCGNLKSNKSKKKKVALPLSYGIIAPKSSLEAERKEKNKNLKDKDIETENEKDNSEKNLLIEDESIKKDQNLKSEKIKEKKEKNNNEKKLKKENKLKNKNDKKVKNGKKDQKDEEECVNIFDEKDLEYIRNLDDLDDWEKDIEPQAAGESDGEIDMMVPWNKTELDASEKSKKSSKNVFSKKSKKRKIFAGGERSNFKKRKCE